MEWRDRALSEEGWSKTRSGRQEGEVEKGKVGIRRWENFWNSGVPIVAFN